MDSEKKQMMGQEQWTHRTRGPVMRVALFGAVSAVLCGVTVWGTLQGQTWAIATQMFAWMTLVIGIMGGMFVLCVVFIFLRSRWFRLEVGTDGFSCETSPFAKASFRYGELNSGRIVCTTYQEKGRTRYSYSFHFTTDSGKKKRVSFQKLLCDREMMVLEARTKASVQEKIM